MSLLCCASGWSCLAASWLRSTAGEFRAVNSRKRNFNQQKLERSIKMIEEKISTYLLRMDQEAANQPAVKLLTVEELRQKMQQLQERKAALRSAARATQGKWRKAGVVDRSGQSRDACRVYDRSLLQRANSG